MEENREGKVRIILERLVGALSKEISISLDDDPRAKANIAIFYAGGADLCLPTKDLKEEWLPAEIAHELQHYLEYLETKEKLSNGKRSPEEEWTTDKKAIELLKKAGYPIELYGQFLKESGYEERLKLFENLKMTK